MTRMGLHRLRNDQSYEVLRRAFDDFLVGPHHAESESECELTPVALRQLVCLGLSQSAVSTHVIIAITKDHRALSQVVESA